MEERIIELEVRLAYQDKVIAELDEVVRGFTKRVQELERELDVLKATVRDGVAEVGPQDENLRTIDDMLVEVRPPARCRDAAVGLDRFQDGTPRGNDKLCCLDVTSSGQRPDAVHVLRAPGRVWVVGRA